MFELGSCRVVCEGGCHTLIPSLNLPTPLFFWFTSSSAFRSLIPLHPSPPSPPSLPELPSPSLLHKPDMLNSSKTCNNGMLFAPWLDPHSVPASHDLPGDDGQGLDDLLSASGVPNLKSGQYPALTNSMFPPEPYLSALDFNHLASDWLTTGQANCLGDLHFSCGYDDFANMDPSNLARLDDCVTNVENNIDICQELLRLSTNLPMFDQSAAPWNQPGAWQPTSTASSCSSATLDASVGFLTPSSSSAGDHEESSDHQQSQRKNVLNPPLSFLYCIAVSVYLFTCPPPLSRLCLLPSYSSRGFNQSCHFNRMIPKEAKETTKSRPNNVFFQLE